MSEGLNLPLTDELREKKHQLEAASLREGMLAGYQDVLASRTVIYEGSIRELLKNRHE